jgi:parallel beta-helix repeat protein
MGIQKAKAALTILTMTLLVSMEIQAGEVPPGRPFQALQDQVDGLRSDVAGVQSDVNNLQSGLSTIQSSLGDLQGRVSELERVTPQTFNLTCGAGSTISDAVKLLKPGDTLLVNGNCSENVSIPEEIHNLTLDGQSQASIAPLDGSQSTVNIRGRGITIARFTLTGGLNGIIVTRGGAAILEGNTIRNAQTGISLTSHSVARIQNNTIENNTDRGVNVAEASTARLDGNTIQNNSSDGVLVNEGSSARIGFDAPNTIQSNGGRGVIITRSSSGRIMNNTISNNRSDGVDVLRGSHADIANNEISGNGIGTAGTVHGILVNYNSAVNMDSANSSSTPNKNFGLACLNGGMVDGRRGTLNGNIGATSFANGCVNNTVP